MPRMKPGLTTDEHLRKTLAWVQKGWNLFVGIDPGASGAIGFQVYGTGELIRYHVQDIPVMKVSRSGKKKSGKTKTKTVANTAGIVSIFKPFERYAGRVHVCLEMGVVQVRGRGASAYNGFRVGCLAAGTPILTNRGCVAIECVLNSDMLWDGTTWVSHSGVVSQGVQPCLTLNGINLTPDHKVLTSVGWLPAEVVRRRLRDTAAPATALLAAGRETENGRESPTLNTTVERSQRINFADFSPWSPVPSIGVTTPNTGIIPGTEDEEFESIPSGDKIGLHSFGTSPSSRGVTNREGVSTGLKTTRDTSPGIFDSPTDPFKPRTAEKPGWWCTKDVGWHSPNSGGLTVLTSSTKQPEFGSPSESGVSTGSCVLHETYDILNAGPRSRFQAGDMIVSNCNYGMWPLFLAGLGFRLHVVMPGVWKKAFKLEKKDKEDSRQLALQWWPQADLQNKGHHDRAEALLLSDYGRRVFEGHLEKETEDEWPTD